MKVTSQNYHTYCILGPWQQLELSDLPLQFAAMVEDLKPATRYSFRVIAEGPAGKSAPSGELLLRTIPQKPAGAPLNLSVLPLSSTELLVTWAPPLVELRNGEIQGFNIGYRVVDMGTYNFTSVNGDGEESGDEVILGGLAKFMRYSVVVQAFNEVGAGPLSEPISAQTMEDGKYSSLFNNILRNTDAFHLFFLHILS